MGVDLRKFYCKISKGLWDILGQTWHEMKKIEKWGIFVALVPQSLVNLLTCLCFDYFAFSVFLLFEFANDATKLSPIPQNMRGEKNFSYNTFLVDVTLAVCELSQKSCSNVNISASAVPKGFLARVKIPIISVVPPLREMFFPLPNFLRTQSTSWSK